MSAEELRRMEYEFGEYKDAFPKDLTNVMELAFDIMRPHITIELPLRNELLPVIKKIMYKQYPSFICCDGNWSIRWIHDICENTAKKLSVDLSLLFADFAKGVNRTEMYNNFESMVRFYISPKEAHRREMPNFEGTPFWEQEKDSILKELEDDYEESKAFCELHNRMKTEFIQAVQPIIFNYFGQQTDTLTTEMWQHYGIALGSAYHDYRDNCSDFEYFLEIEDLTSDPKINFFEYSRQLSAKILSDSENETLQQ